MHPRKLDIPLGKRHAAEEVLLPLPSAREDVPPVTEFRSTWIVSSLTGLRSNGHFEAYSRALRSYRTELLSCVAGSWLPMHVVRAHYEACQTLGFSEQDALSMAVGEGGEVRRTWHASVIGAAKRDDATPWAVFANLHKLWLRGANGGACAVYRAGDHQARIEYVGCELFDIPYFRHAVRAVLVIFAGHVCPELRIVTLPQQEPGEISYQLRWIDEPGT